MKLVWICLLVIVSKSQQANSFFRTYECINDDCQRTKEPISIIDPVKIKGRHTTLEACRLVCGSFRGLWPTPTGPVSIGKNYTAVNVNQVLIDVGDIPLSVESFFAQITEIFLADLRLICGRICEPSSNSVLVHVKIESESLDLDWNTRESYTLSISPKENNVDVSIVAPTVYGARHALETLSQLFAPVVRSSNARGLVVVDRAEIQDKPIFVHRGLLIDTARNFLPVSAILRTIDALAATKMNVLHWHATDSQSFPLQIQSRPLMSWYGAYSAEMIYTPDDIKQIVTYAKQRGVRVILELDSPSHAGAGWEWGMSEGLGQLAVCINQEPWRDFCIQPPCGQLNPVNKNTLDVLKDIYREMLSILGPSGIIHFGGDEVFIDCWKSSEEIVKAMADRGMGTTTNDFLQLWGEFHAKQLKILDELKPGRMDNAMIWSSALTAPEVIERHVNKSRFIIQTWIEASSEIPTELLKLGYKLVMSTKDAWYLDHGFWGKTTYHSWRDAYNNRIPRTEGVLGGEVCMWGEYVNEGGLDSRVWPRAAAVGERLWSDSHTLTTRNVEPRLQAHRERLQIRGIHADAISPAWCAQHAQKCF